MHGSGLDLGIVSLKVRRVLVNLGSIEAVSEGLVNERIGVLNTARLLDVSVSGLKEALRLGKTLRGCPPPQPIIRGGGSTGTLMLFRLGDVMSAAEKIGKK